MTNAGPSDRARSVESFKVMDVLRRANEIESSGAMEVCHCEVGQPGSGAPRPVVRAAVEALPVCTGTFGIPEELPEVTAWRTALPVAVQVVVPASRRYHTDGSCRRPKSPDVRVAA